MKGCFLPAVQVLQVIVYTGDVCAQVCTLRSEAKPPEEAFNPAVKRSGWQPPQDTGLWEIAGQVQDRVCTPHTSFISATASQCCSLWQW